MNLVAKWTGTPLIIRILIGLAIGIILALVCPGAKVIGLLGTVFVSTLKAIAPVLVAVLVASSLANAGKGLGSRFRTVIVLYLLATLIAAAVSVCASYLFPVTIRLQDAAASGEVPDGLASVFGNLLNSMVQNPVKAIAEANYLAVLFWAVLTGLAMRQFLSEAARDTFSAFADAVSKVVQWIIQFAPFGILGLVFTAISENGVSIFVDYGRLLMLLVGCMLTTALVINPIIVAAMIRRNPYPLVLNCLKRSGISAFFTRSSAANIPINMDLCRDMGLNKEFYSVSIPLGATINMSGAATTITVMTLAVCNTVGIDVGIGSAIVLSIVATLGACGSSGVAGGSLLLIPMACSLFGIGSDVAMQAVAVGFIIGVIQDSVETALNSSSDAVFTATAEIYEERRRGLGKS